MSVFEHTSQLAYVHAVHWFNVPTPSLENFVVQTDSITSGSKYFTKIDRDRVSHF